MLDIHFLPAISRESESSFSDGLVEDEGFNLLAVEIFFGPVSRTEVVIEGTDGSPLRC